MATQKLTRQEMLLEAKNFFLDASEYNEYELLGFWRLVNDVYDGYHDYYYGSRPKTLNASIVEYVIKLQNERQYTILRYRYWEGYTLKEIGFRLSLTAQRIQQLKDKSLYFLRRCIGKNSWLSIKVLNLNDKLSNALEKEYISWLSNLARRSEADLLTIDGVDKDDVEEIKQKLAMFGMKLSKRSYLIGSLGLSKKATDLLEANRIIFVDRLISMTEESLLSIKGLDDETREEIVNKRAELLQ